MKEEHYIELLKKADTHGNEYRHIRTDEILIEIIKNELGFEKFIKVYDEMESGFWYA